MLAVLMFVISPLQAAGVLAAHNFGLLFGLVLLVAIFVVSGSLAAVTAVSAAVRLIGVATVLRLRQPSVVDNYLDASAWMIAWDCRWPRRFAPGKLTFHRVIGRFCFISILVLSSRHCSVL